MTSGGSGVTYLTLHLAFVMMTLVVDAVGIADQGPSGFAGVATISVAGLLPLALVATFRTATGRRIAAALHVGSPLAAAVAFSTSEFRLLVWIVVMPMLLLWLLTAERVVNRS